MRMALSRRVLETTHVFDNVLDVFDCTDAAPCIERHASYQDKLQAGLALPRKGVAWCHRHQAWCSIDTKGSARVAGLPCQDYSAAGLQAGIHGRNFPAAVAWGVKCRLVRNPILVVECVPQLPVCVPHDICGPEYIWPLTRMVTPAAVGFPFINRPRLPSVQLCRVCC